jgi:tRNA G18 (ribose-2'-O)-methylase SpoU
MKPLRGTELKRFLRRCQRPELDLQIMLADVEDPVNVGSAFRIADAVKASGMIMTGITPTPPHRLIERVGRSKDRRVPWKHLDDAQTAISALKEESYQIVALELTADAQPYHHFEYGNKVCLIVGHEDHGVTRRILEQVDATVYIPMFGKGASLNVSVSLGIACFQMIQAAEWRQEQA